MIRRVMLPLFLLGVLSGPPALQGGEANNELAVWQVYPGGESSFSVVDGKVIAKSPDQETCETDNTHLQSALQAKGISLDPYDYRVDVKELTLAGATEKVDHGKALYHYEVEFVDFDYVAKDALSVMLENKRLKTRLAAAEAPTTCYAFLGDHSLHLLCQYGLQELSAMKDVIDDILRKSR